MSAIWFVETAHIFLIFLFAIVQVSIENEKHESYGGYQNI